MNYWCMKCKKPVLNGRSPFHKGCGGQVVEGAGE